LKFFAIRKTRIILHLGGLVPVESRGVGPPLHLVSVVEHVELEPRDDGGPSSLFFAVQIPGLLLPV